ncbi:MAG: S-layer protein, partial [Methanolinea sp.]|nr:S-layer protein [Methanolinea sp.]
LGTCCLPVSATDPTVIISAYTVTPSVLSPGGSGTIQATLTNTASSAILRESSGISISGEFQTTRSTDIPVTIDSVQLVGDDIKVIDGNFKQFGAIGPGQSVTVTFAIEAPPKEGLYFPEVWVEIDGGKNVRYPVPVNVNTDNYVMQTPALVVYKDLPDSVNPGESFPVILTLSNAGSIRASDIILTSSTSTTSLGSMGPNTLSLKPMDGGEYQNMTLEFITDRYVPVGLQKILLTIDYKLPDGTQKHQVETIEVPIKGKAELGFVSVDTTPRRVTAGTPFDLTIRIENTGTGEAKQVTATIDLPMTGTRQSFIGKIKPSNDAPAVFLLDGGSGGTYGYNATITYTDDIGTHTVVFPMTLRVIPEDYTGIILIVLIIAIVAGFLVYRYWYLPRKNGNGALPWVKKNSK